MFLPNLAHRGCKIANSGEKGKWTASGHKKTGPERLGFSVVWMTGLEPATSWSLTRCATNCATSRGPFFKGTANIGILFRICKSLMRSLFKKSSSSSMVDIEDECLHRSKTWTGTGENSRKCLYGSRKWTCTSTQPRRNGYFDPPVGVVRASCRAFRADLRAEEARMRRMGPLTTAKVFMSSLRASGEKLG